jgi:hypothetical protein
MSTPGQGKPQQIIRQAQCWRLQLNVRVAQEAFGIHGCSTWVGEPLTGAILAVQCATRAVCAEAGLSSEVHTAAVHASKQTNAGLTLTMVQQWCK